MIQVMLSTRSLPDKVKVASNLQEDEFIESLESLEPQISSICLSKETTLIEKACESLDYFVKFFSSGSKAFKKLHIDCDNVASHVSQLSRIFHVRGYSNEKANAMKLVFQIAELTHNNVFLMRCFSFFLQTTSSKSSEFEDIIQKKMLSLHDVLFDNYMRLATLKSPRTENAILLCLLDLAYYYYLKNNKDMAFSLIEMVKEAINSTLTYLIGQCNVVRMYLHFTQFKILVKEENYSLEGASALHKEVEQMCNCYKSQVYFSSEDPLLYPAIQFDVINELFSYHSLRFTPMKLIPYVRLLLGHGFLNGCSLRIIQMASMYSHIQYQLECMNKFLVSFL